MDVLKKALLICLASALLLLSSCATSPAVAPDTQGSDVTESAELGDEAQTEGTADKEYDIGDSVYFGKYEQNNDYSDGNEDVEWIVLDRFESSYLVLSKYGIDNKSYNDRAGAVDWTGCTLRQWLNDEFYRACFTDEEKKYILDTSSQLYTDKVFCLSADQVEKYFPSVSSRITSATLYAQAQGSYQEDDACGWWLKGAGDSNSVAARVNIKGNILTSGSTEGGVERTDYSVRPAMWISFDEKAQNEFEIPEENEFTIKYIYNDTTSDIIGIALNGEEIPLAGEYTYDDEGKLLLNTDCGMTYEEYEYDSNGYCTRINTYWKGTDELYHYTVLKSSSDGNVVREEYYDENGVFNYAQEYSYDENGNVIREVYLDNEGVAGSSMEYTYDRQGLLSALRNYDGDGKLISYKMYNYDEEGNKTKISTYDNQSSFVSAVIYENEYRNGSLYKTTVYRDGEDPEDASCSYYIENGKFEIDMLNPRTVSVCEYDADSNIVRRYVNFGG